MYVNTTSIESPENNTQVHIPKHYHDLLDVLSKTKAMELPPHRSYDCNIDLLPGTTSPRGQIYPLCSKEQQAIEEYIQEALRQKYILLSTSPVFMQRTK